MGSYVDQDGIWRQEQVEVFYDDEDLRVSNEELRKKYHHADPGEDLDDRYPMDGITDCEYRPIHEWKTVILALGWSAVILYFASTVFWYMVGVGALAYGVYRLARPEFIGLYCIHLDGKRECLYSYQRKRGLVIFPRIVDAVRQAKSYLPPPPDPNSRIRTCPNCNGRFVRSGLCPWCTE